MGQRERTDMTARGREAFAAHTEQLSGGRKGDGDAAVAKTDDDLRAGEAERRAPHPRASDVGGQRGAH